jgi:hypothetical protein
LYRAVVALEQLHATLQRLLAVYAPDRLLIGAGTGAKRLRAQLREWFPNAVWELVAEHNTTLRARELYFPTKVYPYDFRTLSVGKVRELNLTYDRHAKNYLTANNFYYVPLMRGMKVSEDRTRGQNLESFSPTKVYPYDFRTLSVGKVRELNLTYDRHAKNSNVMDQRPRATARRQGALLVPRIQHHVRRDEFSLYDIIIRENEKVQQE